MTSRAAPLRQICVDAKHARTIADSLAALDDCRVEARHWQDKADSLQTEANRLEKASLLNLHAARAASAAEKHQQSLAISNGQKYTEAERRARHRGAIVVLLLVWNIFTGYLLIAN